MATDPTSLPTLAEIQQSKKDMTDINTFVASEQGGFTDNTGKPRKTMSGIESEANELISEKTTELNEFIDEVKESRGYNNAGTFAAGFTYEKENDVGLDAGGNPWILIDTSALPFVVVAGTTPTNPPYKQVVFGTAGQTVTNTSDTVQSFINSFALKIFQSPTDGGLTEIQTRTVDAGEVYEVRKASSGEFATIYSNADGTTEIVQDGTSNVSGGAGVVEFYVADGSYYVEVGGFNRNFSTLCNKSLATIDDLKISNPNIGDQLETTGYHSAGDGGACSYIITNKIADGYGSHELSNGLTATINRVGSVFNAAHYGVYQDRNNSNASHNTLCIQSSLNDIGSVDSGDLGGTVIVPNGARFNLKNLSLPKKSNIEYSVGDDRTQPSNFGGVRDTNERVFLSANANNSGIVNETQFSASFHPGVVVNVQKDLDGHDSYLGSGQSRTDVVRASYNILDDFQNTWRTIYQSHSDESIFSGVSNEPFVNRVEVAGVGEGSFSVLVEQGDLVSGVTSGAEGFVLTSAPSSMVLTWFSGGFQVGEKLTINKGTRLSPILETSTDITTSVTPTRVIGTSLSWGRRWGEVSVGLPPNSTFGVFSIGGRSTVSPTRNFGQSLQEVVFDPVRSWAVNLEGSPSGLDLSLDTSKPITKRRLYVRDYKNSTNKGAVGTSLCFCTIDSNAAASTSSLNVDSVVKNSTGDYTVNFTDSAVRADYTVVYGIEKITSGMSDLHIDTFIRATGLVRFRVYTRTTGVLTDIPANHRVSIQCKGGDL